MQVDDGHDVANGTVASHYMTIMSIHRRNAT